ncbi:uncharacterized protein L203_103518 [Cryptococcus depauperatus CBS 7841]|uniref:Uncharacterized protein n=1 Tax=Cryptococcus depauperatus CBS 7841 TaxID=1295531 RepID=A0A1E3IIB4_9TREE|nr:hypothetical protein L203_02887 [Cryptococcus depauperatus CBS 7841]
MEVTPHTFIFEIVEKYKELPADKRLLVAVAGPPGSGKSTFAYPLADALNVYVLGHAPINPSFIESPSSHLLATSSSKQKSSDEVAVTVGLDGWHYSRKELDDFDDPKEAHWRRGAAFTFDLSSYLAFLSLLRLPLHPNPPKEIPFPTFDHAAKDPAPSAYPILPRHRIIVVEGLYTLLDMPGWRKCADMMDIGVWVDVEEEIARERVIKRNWEAGIVESLEKCVERVDAVDMKNGEQVRSHLVQPTYIIKSINGQPFSLETVFAA